MSGAPRLAPKVRLKWDRREGRHMVIFPERGLVLNVSAAAILKLCDGARSNDAIATELAAPRGADMETVRRDVSAFLDEMRRRGLVVDGDPG
jgi:pyrroloquinoline quinone biosynthesis protein D